MKKQLYDLLIEADKEAAAYLETQGVDVSQFAPQKVAFFCGQCGRVLNVVRGALVCSRHGIQARLLRSDGTPLSAEEIRRFTIDRAA